MSTQFFQTRRQQMVTNHNLRDQVASLEMDTETKMMRQVACSSRFIINPCGPSRVSRLQQEITEPRGSCIPRALPCFAFSDGIRPEDSLKCVPRGCAPARPARNVFPEVAPLPGQLLICLGGLLLYSKDIRHS